MSPELKFNVTWFRDFEKRDDASIYRQVVDDSRHSVTGVTEREGQEGPWEGRGSQESQGKSRPPKPSPPPHSRPPLMLPSHESGLSHCVPWLAWPTKLLRRYHQCGHTQKGVIGKQGNVCWVIDCVVHNCDCITYCSAGKKWLRVWIFVEEHWGARRPKGRELWIVSDLGTVTSTF